MSDNNVMLSQDELDRIFNTVKKDVETTLETKENTPSLSQAELDKLFGQSSGEALLTPEQRLRKEITALKFMSDSEYLETCVNAEEPVVPHRRNEILEWTISPKDTITFKYNYRGFKKHCLEMIEKCSKEENQHYPMTDISVNMKLVYMAIDETFEEPDSFEKFASLKAYFSTMVRIVKKAADYLDWVDRTENMSDREKEIINREEKLKKMSGFTHEYAIDILYAKIKDNLNALIDAYQGL